MPPFWKRNIFIHQICWRSKWAVAQSLSCVWIFVTLWTAACQASLSFTVSWGLLKLMSVELAMLSNRLLLCHPLLLLPSFFHNIRVLVNEWALLIRWLKYWSLSLSISPSNEYSGLISFRMDWFDLLAVQGTLKSFLQHHSSKASVLGCSGFFMVHLLHLYTTTRKTIALTIWIFVSKVITLLLITLSRLAIAFLLRSTWVTMCKRCGVHPGMKQALSDSESLVDTDVQGAVVCPAFGDGHNSSPFLRAYDSPGAGPDASCISPSVLRWAPSFSHWCYFTDEETEAQRGYSFAQVTGLQGEVTGAWESDLTSEPGSCPLLPTGFFGGSSWHCYELDEVPWACGLPR